MGGASAREIVRQLVAELEKQQGHCCGDTISIDYEELAAFGLKCYLLALEDAAKAAWLKEIAAAIRALAGEEKERNEQS